jgi:hypothetical protein
VSNLMNPLMVKMFEDILGENIFYGTAKLFARDRKSDLPPNLQVNKTLIAGILLTEKSLCPNLKKPKKGDVIFGKYYEDRMYECDVIIIPRRVFEGGPGGQRIDQILCGGFERPDFYEKEILDGKKIGIFAEPEMPEGGK